MKDDLELENQALTALTMNNLVPLSNTGGANNLANRHHSSAQGANNAAGQGTLFYANHICIKSWHSDLLKKYQNNEALIIFELKCPFPNGIFYGLVS